MFDAQLLMQGSTVYSPWTQRGGDALQATLDVVAVSSATIKVEVFTKNSEDTGDGSNAVTAGDSVEIQTSAVGVQSQKWDPDDVASTVGLKQMVRYKFTVTGTGSAWILFRMLSPVWWDAVDA